MKQEALPLHMAVRCWVPFRFTTLTLGVYVVLRKYGRCSGLEAIDPGIFSSEEVGISWEVVV